MSEFHEVWGALVSSYNQPLTYAAEPAAASHDLLALMRLEQRFIELLTFSTYDEIVWLLDRTYATPDEFLALPVWIRNLAFRLACLQQPGNAEIRERAATDLRLFGPDWDSIADDLDQEAQRIRDAKRL